MIIINNEEALRVKCSDVLPEEVADLVLALESELEHSAKIGREGIGLAATQIGIAKKIAIVRMPGTSINLVNCNIEKAYDLGMFRDEGCLSFPGKIANTNRYQEIVIADNLVYPHNFIVTGLIAVCCQHEIDHYNEKIFTDYAIKEAVKKKIGPNDPCPCGKINKNTGLIIKYKKCCGS